MFKIKTFSRFAVICMLPSVLALSSCKKDSHDDDHSHDEDSSKPVIAMTSPSQMQVYDSGDTVYIKGTVSDNSLHELLIKVQRDSDDSTMFIETPTVHDLTTYSIDTYWISQVSDHTNARVIVLAEDHSKNVSSDTIRIHIMP